MLKSQTVINKLLAWTQISGVKLNPDKTKWVQFSRKQHINRATPPALELKVDEQTLERVQSIRYLGVILQENLRWNAHLEKVSRMVCTIETWTINEVSGCG